MSQSNSPSIEEMVFTQLNPFFALSTVHIDALHKLFKVCKALTQDINFHFSAGEIHMQMKGGTQFLDVKLVNFDKQICQSETGYQVCVKASDLHDVIGNIQLKNTVVIFMLSEINFHIPATATTPPEFGSIGIIVIDKATEKVQNLNVPTICVETGNEFMEKQQYCDILNGNHPAFGRGLYGIVDIPEVVHLNIATKELKETISVLEANFKKSQKNNYVYLAYGNGQFEAKMVKLVEGVVSSVVGCPLSAIRQSPCEKKLEVKFGASNSAETYLLKSDTQSLTKMFTLAPFIRMVMYEESIPVTEFRVSIGNDFGELRLFVYYDTTSSE